MSGPAPTKRTLMMVESYQAGATMNEVATLFGVTAQRVQQAVHRHAPEIVRPGSGRFPAAGPAGHEIYRVGSCTKCEIALFAYRPEPRELCGRCAAP